MDYLDSAEEAKFRADLRAWLATVEIEDWKKEKDIPRARALLRDWVRAVGEAGYLAVTWPEDEGGQGLSPVYNMILNYEFGAADVPEYPGPATFFSRLVAIHGTPEQRERFLPATFNADMVWCQGFSEPGAGSDLANMSTRAEKRGDKWVVNGQKLWTTWAAFSDWCFLLARTDPDAPKHRGISAFVLPLDTPGVEVRKVWLANGEPESAEVFFTDAEIPEDQMIGQPGDGWRIAMSTFTYERNPAETDVIAGLWARLRAVEGLARDYGRIEDPSVRQRLAEIAVRIEGLQCVGTEQLSRRIKAGELYPGEESSIGKLLWTYTGQDLEHLALDIAGVDPILEQEPVLMRDFFWSRVLSIFGGSAQIQKNVLSWRVLGLPRI